MIKIIITGDLGVNTYLYNFKDKNIAIIDPGSDFDKIEREIKKGSFIPKVILLTHGHFDHIGAVKQFKNKYSIPVYIHKDDSKFLGEAGKDSHMEMFRSMGPNSDYFFKNYYSENDEADTLLNDKDYLDEIGLEVIHTPGHSEGSICFYSKSNSIIFTGDTMFKGGMGRTDFPGGNYNKLVNSLYRLISLPLETKVYPGHGDSSTIGNES